MYTVTIALEEAPAFIAGLIEQELSFDAVQNEDDLVITFL